MMLVVVLDNLRSAYNVGSIFRTADAFGIKKLYLCGSTIAPTKDQWIHKINKTALGAEKTVSWEYAQSTLEIVNQLKTANYTTIALEQAPNSIKLSEFTKHYHLNANRYALIVGNEVAGVSEAVLAVVNYIVEIPMQGTKESLNVSVTFGIAAYALSILSDHRN